MERKDEELKTLTSVPETVKAAVYRSFGGPEVLEIDLNWPLRHCTRNDVIIKVHAASINPVDYKFMSGFLGFIPFVGLRPPSQFGFDVSGVVVHVGGSCRRLAPGDEVWAMSNFRFRGTWAEYVVISEKRTRLKPKNLTFDEAASMPLVIQTSYQALIVEGGLWEGATLLILGGATATGFFLCFFFPPTPEPFSCSKYRSGWYTNSSQLRCACGSHG